MPKTTPSITAVIIARDEADMIANCIETVRWCDDIIVIDNGSIDATPELARELGARVIEHQTDSFANLRSRALKYVKTDWLFYVDADERVTPSLSSEVLVQIETTPAHALKTLRHNYMYGQKMEHGGWQHDWVTRIFRRSRLKGWFGQIHESPDFDGEAISLHHPLIHLTHRNTVDGLLKSASWTPIEAELLASNLTQAITARTLLRKALMEIFRRLVVKKGYRDGMVGWIEALIQGMNRLLVYIQVWEQQQSPSLSEKYQTLEQEIAGAWRKHEMK